MITGNFFFEQIAKAQSNEITARDSLNGATPFDLAALLLDKKIPALAGQFKVSADDVCLKPSLIEYNVSKRSKTSTEGGDIHG